MSNPKVGYIILSWNNAKLLPTCFVSIAKQSYDNSRTILVDNDSSDNSVQLTTEEYPWVEVIETGHNGGFTQGNNFGIKRLLEDPEIEYIALINSDATLDPDWTRRVVSFATQKPLGAFYQGTTLDFYNHAIIDSTHIYVARNGQATQGSWRLPYLSDNGPNRVFGVNAAACLISRNFIDAQPFDQFFDESFFMYLEDVDICLRAIMMGWDSYQVPDAFAYHMGSASSAANASFPLRMTYRNNLAMLVKNLPYQVVLSMIPKIIKSDILTTRLLLSKNNRKGAYALIKGRLTGVGRVFLYMKKHQTMMRNVKIDLQYLKKLMRNGA